MKKVSKISINLNTYWLSYPNFIMIGLILSYCFCNIVAIFFIFILFRSSQKDLITVIISILFFVVISVFKVIFEYFYQKGLLLLQKDLRFKITRHHKKYYLKNKSQNTKYKFKMINNEISNQEFFISNFFRLKYDFLLILISALFLLILCLIFHFFVLMAFISLILLVNCLIDNLLKNKINKFEWLSFYAKKQVTKFVNTIKNGNIENNDKEFLKRHLKLINIRENISKIWQKIQLMDNITSLILFFLVIIYFYYFVKVNTDFFYIFLITLIFCQNFIMLLFKKLKNNISNFPRYHALSKIYTK